MGESSLNGSDFDDGGRDPMNILIADDHSLVRQGLKRLLSSESDMAVIGEAQDAGQTLDLARKLDWHVLILDYSMPGADGLRLLKELTHDYPRRPVLVLSVHPEDTIAIPVLKAGAAGYIHKEFASEGLAIAIRKVASGGRYASPELMEQLAAGRARAAPKRLHDALSAREYRVMWLIASGKPLTVIATELGLSPSTVSTYRTRILKKLKLNSNVDLVRYAIRHRLLERP